MRQAAIVLLCALWLYRIQRLLREERLVGARLFMRLWIENALAVGVMVPLAAGPTPRPLPVAAALAVGIGLGFGLIVTVVMYLWGVRRK